jgi:hypothetical protein
VNVEKEIEELKQQLAALKEEVKILKTPRDPKLLAQAVRKSLNHENDKITIHYIGLNGKEGTIKTWGYFNDRVVDERIIYGDKLNPHELKDEHENHLSVSLTVVPTGIKVYYKSKDEKDTPRCMVYWSQVTTIDT